MVPATPGNGGYKEDTLVMFIHNLLPHFALLVMTLCVLCFCQFARCPMSRIALKTWVREVPNLLSWLVENPALVFQAWSTNLGRWLVWVRVRIWQQIVEVERERTVQE